MVLWVNDVVAQTWLWKTAAMRGRGRGRWDCVCFNNSAHCTGLHWLPESHAQKGWDLMRRAHSLADWGCDTDAITELRGKPPCRVTSQIWQHVHVPYHKSLLVENGSSVRSALVSPAQGRVQKYKHECVFMSHHNESKQKYFLITSTRPDFKRQHIPNCIKVKKKQTCQIPGVGWSRCA